MSSPAVMIPDTEEPLHATLVQPLLPPESSSFGEDEPAVVLVSDRSEGRIEQASLDVPDLRVDESTWDHGETQSPSYRNSFWAVLFLLQVSGVVVLAIMATIALSKGEYPSANSHDDHNHGEDVSDDDTIDWSSWWHHFKVAEGMLFFLATIFSITAMSAVLILVLLGPLADMMIQLSLVVSPISFGLSAIVSLVVGQIGPAIMLGIFCALGVWYAMHVWHRIPFATANLAVAMAALRANKGLLSMAYAFTILAIIWSLVWLLAVIQVNVVQSEWTRHCHPDPSSTYQGEMACDLSTRGKLITLGLFLSLCWTCQVIKNVLHTTVAGVVGTFWFVPSEGSDESNSRNGNGGSCCGCNSTIVDSWVRSSWYSFGSICLGSLLVAVLQTLQLLVKLARQQNDENRRVANGGRQQASSLLWCLLEFIVDQAEKLMEYINSWAFVYVGLYGYEYWTASRKVYQLFRARGWSVILNDHLIGRSLAMMQLFIGILSGALAVILGMVFHSVGIHPVASFFLGLILGIILSEIQLQVVTSAVETVVVCFAEAPSLLVENHPPELSGRMIRAWRAAYPDECGF